MKKTYLEKEELETHNHKNSWALTKSNNSILYSQLKTINFICGNCNQQQKLSEEYFFVGYCINGCFSGERNLNDLDEVTFVCSNCSKVSFNNALTGQPNFKLLKISDNHKNLLNILKDNNQNYLYDLFQEYIYCLNLNLTSAVILLSRKILIHFACELGCQYKKNERFFYYVNFIKETKILGKKWNEKLELIVELGNEENHVIKIATHEELDIIKIIINELINSHFFVENVKRQKND